MLTRCDLNADVGEGFDQDRELLELVTSANVACGFHAGDSSTMRESCAQAVSSGVVVGAQVSYRDREGFGRRRVEIEAAPLEADLEEQVEALRSAGRLEGTAVRYLKPHGALYNRAVHDAAQAGAVVAVARRHGLAVLGLPGSVLLRSAAEAGVPVFGEFFADRGYDVQARLVPRSEPGALVSDAADVAARVHRLVTRGVVGCVDGSDVPVAADSICVHGDGPHAVELATATRTVLERLGVAVRSFR